MKSETLQPTETPMADDRVLTAGNFKPILFSTPMVEAILKGEKNQTRRIIKIQEGEKIEFDNSEMRKCFLIVGNGYIKSLKCPYKVGDILWVRETWQHTKCLNIAPDDENFGYIYRASKNGQEFENNFKEWKWKPSIFMPKESSRIFLKIKSIRIERLMYISIEDAISEGIEFKRFILPDGEKMTGYKIYGSKDSWDENPIVSYWSLWDYINGRKTYELNPFVWVYEFERTDVSFACS